LGHLPTPLEFAPRFSETLGGPRVWLKRDDCTGLLFGGNKTRHNEFLLADAIAKGADMFVWGAGVQSNNCRQTAACCVKAGLDCHLVLGRGRPLSDDDPDSIQGNLLLDHIIGATVEIVPEAVGGDLDNRIAERAEQFRAAGRTVYTWDRGSVKPLAAVSYILCLLEVIEQSAAAGFTPDAVYVCSAGSTGSGLAIAAAALGCQFPIVNICPIQWEWDTQEDMARIANQAAELIGIETRLSRDDLQITFDHIGPGYGKVSTGGLEAMQLLARTEAVLLDPVYSGKALAGLIADTRAGRLSPRQNVVFIHTGGTPAVFAMSEELAAGIAARKL
jgi:1-aminocyclopropane-1-carboxylate deaminase/D-cysteine desulfhydrase-like pyridoxal-dependent ACC family enzyme